MGSTGDGLREQAGALSTSDSERWDEEVGEVERGDRSRGANRL
jgi:hypothetical protein